jgi:hypothetical protein
MMGRIAVVTSYWSPRAKNQKQKQKQKQAPSLSSIVDRGSAMVGATRVTYRTVPYRTVWALLARERRRAKREWGIPLFVSRCDDWWVRPRRRETHHFHVTPLAVPCRTVSICSQILFEIIGDDVIVQSQHYSYEYVTVRVVLRLASLRRTCFISSEGSVCLFVCLLVCLSACLLVCLSACLLVCPFVRERRWREAKRQEDDAERITTTHKAKISQPGSRFPEPEYPAIVTGSGTELLYEEYGRHA